MGAERTVRLSGAAVALLFGVGSAIWGLGMPNAGAPVAEVLDFYDERYARIIIGASLSLLAIAAFVLFAAALRTVLIESSGSDALPTAAFGGAVLGAAAGLGAETINLTAALRAREDELGRQLGQALFEISQILGSTASGVGMGLFGVAAGAAGLRGSVVLPRWVCVVLLIVGILLLSPLAHVNEVAGAGLVVMTAVVAIGVRD